RATVSNVGFFNLAVLKNFHKIALSVTHILSQAKKHKENECVLVCYSMHLPFLVACYMATRIRKDIHLCVIVPDLPEYMSVRTGFMKLVFKMLSKVSYFVVNRADSIVAITAQMVNVFRADIKKVVIEGIADAKYISAGDAECRENYFLYSGTLDRRYGIRNLLDSFLTSGIDNYELLICGDGDDRAYVESIAADNPRVKFLGQLDRSAVLNFQRNAKLLINPRNNESTFTKFSFPSKVIEYMSSGTPVLMYALDGIPDEYYDFCFVVPPGDNGLAAKLREVSKLSDVELVAKGRSAKEFIIENKMPGVQVHKLLEKIRGERYV
ncbi:MAG: glycosyltransferase, partial [Pseudomonas sp.]|uniref:glycosyltransferase n=1 Tax=Pseudomonas sp. TaxID=306 RepID=UPI003C750DDA